jgi:hypothetical protein
MTIFKDEVIPGKWFLLRYKGEPCRAMVADRMYIAPQCRTATDREYVIIQELKGHLGQTFICPASKFEINDEIMPAMDGPWELKYCD